MLNETIYYPSDCSVWRLVRPICVLNHSVFTLISSKTACNSGTEQSFNLIHCMPGWVTPDLFSSSILLPKIKEEGLSPCVSLKIVLQVQRVQNLLLS